MTIYLAGSLNNPRIPLIAKELRSRGLIVFDDWYAAGPKADECWRAYEIAKGHNLAQALRGEAAQNTFQFDRRHIEACDIMVLVLPAGRSGHLELGWAIGQGKKGFVMLDADPDRYDVMYAFASGVVYNIQEFLSVIGRG